MTAANLMLPNGRVLAVDEKGYLLDYADWTVEVATHMADLDGIRLNPDHWAIIDIFQDYYSRFDIEPPMRALVKKTRDRLGEDKANSRFLYRLFPQGPGTQACRYSGLPRPVSCI